MGLIALFYNNSSARMDEYLAKVCFVNLIKILKYIPDGNQNNQVDQSEPPDLPHKKSTSEEYKEQKNITEEGKTLLSLFLNFG